MMKFLLNQVGKHAAHAAVGSRLRESRFNVKLGFAAFRDKRISFWVKLLALALGGGITALLIALEIAPESLLALLVPFGFALDFVADGLEAIIVPVVAGALILPFVAPRDVVDQIMAERAGHTELPPLPSQ